MKTKDEVLDDLESNGGSNLFDFKSLSSMCSPTLYKREKTSSCCSSCSSNSNSNSNSCIFLETILHYNTNKEEAEEKREEREKRETGNEELGYENENENGDVCGCTCHHLIPKETTTSLSTLPWYKRNVAARTISSLSIGPLVIVVIWKIDLFLSALLIGFLVAIGNFEYYWMVHRIRARINSSNTLSEDLPRCCCLCEVQYATPHIFSSATNSYVAIRLISNRFYNGNDTLAAFLVACQGSAICFLFALAGRNLNDADSMSTATFSQLSIFASSLSFLSILLAAFSPSVIDGFVNLIASLAYSITVLNFLCCGHRDIGCSAVLGPLNVLALAAIAIMAIRAFSIETALDAFIIVAMDLTGLLYVLGMICILGNFLDRPSRVQNDSRCILIAFLFVVWGADTSAYLVGKIMEYFSYRNSFKLAPHLSPNKDIEGTMAAILGGIAGIYFAQYLLVVGGYSLPGSSIRMIGFASVGTIFGRFGDLVQSMIKRAAGVKDSSSLLPGHGGLLDRIDALLFVAVVFSQY